jgi:hypothetical protein
MVRGVEGSDGDDVVNAWDTAAGMDGFVDDDDR